MAKTSLTNAEKKDLEAAGYVEGNALTVPLNISPILRQKIYADIEANRDPKPVEGTESYMDKPTADERQNELVRQRAAADGDVEMQKVTGVHPLDHDADGVKGGTKASSANRQGSVNK